MGKIIGFLLQVFVAIGAVLGAIAAVFGLTFIALLFNAYVAVKLWGWYITPTFHVPAPSYLVAVGIGLFVSLYTKRSSDSADETLTVKVDQTKFSLGFIATPLLVWFLGWIIHAYLIPWYG